MKAIKLEAVIDDHHELYLKLPENVKAGRVEVIVMYDDDDDLPLSQSILDKTNQPLRKFGQFRGQIQMSGDFNDPLPDEFWLGEN